MPEVLVAGAGPAGLVLAVVLAESGVDARIVDRKPGPVMESRAAIVHVRTLELLDRLGLAERAVASGVRTARVEIFERGRRASEFPLVGRGSEARTPFPFALGLGQDRIEELLVERLAELGRQVEWGTELTSLTGSTARLRRNGVEETVTARWVVGADGAHSQVRDALGIGFAGGTFDQTGLLADVEFDAAGAGLAAGTLRLNLTRGGFVGVLPLGDGRHRIFGAVPPEIATGGDGVVSTDAFAQVPVDELQRWFDGYFAVPATLRDVAWTALFRIHSRIAERFRSGDTFLVGDAAHVHSPAGGQGMNLAIGDAFNLGWKLGAVANGHAHERLLDSYEAERRPVARTVLRVTDRGFALETTRHPVTSWLRSHVAVRLVGPLTRLGVVRAMIFRLFSQTWISYRRSPVVGGRASGGMHPGDRVPGFDGGGLTHRLLLFDAARTPELDTLIRRYAVPIGVQAMPARSTRLVLIRPDGHLGYVGPAADLDALSSYLDRVYLRC